jgi:hypothetical protein
MLTRYSHQALYAAFDRFPSAKGAAVHIDRAARQSAQGYAPQSVCEYAQVRFGVNLARGIAAFFTRPVTP